MKYFLPIIYVALFGIGLAMVLRADSGLFGSYYPSLISGSLVSIFSGSALVSYLHNLHKICSK